MATQAYLWHYLVGGGLLALFGTLAHVARAVFNVLPDRLSDRTALDLLVSDGYDLNDWLFGTEYDDAGYYRVDSVRNWRIAVLSTTIGGWLVMLLVPGMSGLIAGWINDGFAWLWQLFLYRLSEIGKS